MYKPFKLCLKKDSKKQSKNSFFFGTKLSKRGCQFDGQIIS